MVINPRLITLVGRLLGGGFGLMPLFSWNGSDRNTNPADIKTLTTSSPTKSPLTLSAPSAKHSPHSDEKNKNTGNCVVRGSLKELRTEVWNLGINEYRYVTISCEKTSLDTKEKLYGPWVGLFPETLFKRSSTFGAGTRFEMQTKTKELSSNSYQTVFTGNRIRHSPMTGEWKEQSEEIVNKNIKVVTVTFPFEAISSEKIYIIFQ